MKFESFFGGKSSNNEEKQKSGLTRRDFLRGAATLAGSVVLGEGANQVSNIVEGKTFDDYRRDIIEFTQEAELTEKIIGLKEEIKNRYNISVVLDYDEFVDTAAALDSVGELRFTKQIEALETIQIELSKYPDFLITQYGLEQIVVTTRSRNSNYINKGGFVTLGNIETAKSQQKPELVLFYDWNYGHHVPDEHRYKKDTLPAHVSKSTGAEEYRQSEARKEFSSLVHHELAHYFIDVPGSESTPRLDESKLINDWDDVFSNFNQRIRMVCESEALYTMSDGKEKLDFSRLQTRPPGFVRGYGLTNDREDRATIVEEIMTQYGQMQLETYDDDILNDKIELIKKYYLEASSGLMNDEYWEVINRISSKDEAQGFLVVQTERIIKTPYAESSYRYLVGEETYKQWQEKLKTTKIAKDFNLVN